MSINLSYYRRQVKKLKAKVVAHAFAGDTEAVEKLEKEIANYEKYVRRNESKGGLVWLLIFILVRWLVL